MSNFKKVLGIFIALSITACSQHVPNEQAVIVKTLPDVTINTTARSMHTFSVNKSARLANSTYIARNTNMAQVLPNDDQFMPVYFEVRSAIIDPTQKRKLDVNAQYMELHPNMIVQLTGHTDKSGGHTADNIVLGLKRADAVKKYLVDVHKINSLRIFTRSAGAAEAQALSKNINSFSRIKERSVVFNVLKP